MRFSTRSSLIILLFGLLLVAVILFHSFILKYLAAPIALVLWVFWRLLQSIDQTLYWMLLILCALLAGLARLIRLVEKESTVLGPTTQPDSKAILERIRYWRSSIRLASPGATGPHTVEHHLGKMLAELYTSQQPNATYFEIYAALEEHQLPLPKPIDVFLFPPDTPSSGQPFRRSLQAIWDMLRKQIRRWMGREMADYHQSLEQVLTFLESSLERKP